MLSLLSSLEEGEDDDDDDSSHEKQRNVLISQSTESLLQARKLAVRMLKFQFTRIILVKRNGDEFRCLFKVSYALISLKSGGPIIGKTVRMGSRHGGESKDIPTIMSLEVEQPHNDFPKAGFQPKRKMETRKKDENCGVCKITSDCVEEIGLGLSVSHLPCFFMEELKLEDCLQSSNSCKYGFDLVHVLDEGNKISLPAPLGPVCVTGYRRKEDVHGGISDGCPKGCPCPKMKKNALAKGSLCHSVLSSTVGLYPGGIGNMDLRSIVLKNEKVNDSFLVETYLHSSFHVTQISSDFGTHKHPLLRLSTMEDENPVVQGMICLNMGRCTPPKLLHLLKTKVKASLGSPSPQPFLSLTLVSHARHLLLDIFIRHLALVTPTKAILHQPIPHTKDILDDYKTDDHTHLGSPDIPLTSLVLRTSKPHGPVDKTAHGGLDKTEDHVGFMNGPAVHRTWSDFGAQQMLQMSLRSAELSPDIFEFAVEKDLGLFPSITQLTPDFCPCKECPTDIYGTHLPRHGKPALFCGFSAAEGCSLPKRVHQCVVKHGTFCHVTMLKKAIAFSDSLLLHAGRMTKSTSFLRFAQRSTRRWWITRKFRSQGNVKVITFPDYVLLMRGTLLLILGEMFFTQRGQKVCHGLCKRTRKDFSRSKQG